MIISLIHLHFTVPYFITFILTFLSNMIPHPTCNRHRYLYPTKTLTTTPTIIYKYHLYIYHQNMQQLFLQLYPSQLLQSPFINPPYSPLQNASILPTFNPTISVPITPSKYSRK
eukprot:117333_1